MNSQWLIGQIPKPPADYSQQYMNALIRAVEETFRAARNPGQLEVSKVNISQLPTSSVGLRAGDLWNDTGTVKVV